MKFYHIFLITLLLSNCKEDFSNRTTDYVDQETKDFVLYQPGTWWEYLNTSTNEIDTWKVIAIQYDITRANEFNPNNVEEYLVRIKSTKFNDFDFYISMSAMILVSKKTLGLSQDAFFNPALGVKKNQTCDNNYLDLKSSDTLNSKFIKCSFEVNPSPCTDFFPKYYEWKRHIGLEKMICLNGDTLILSSSFIKQ